MTRGCDVWFEAVMCASSWIVEYRHWICTIVVLGWLVVDVCNAVARMVCGGCGEGLNVER